ncbi:MAG: PAS domain S-box protein, partial [Methanobacterium sp.]
MIDRTNKKGIKGSVSQSGDKFKEIFRKSSIGILFYDEQGKLTDSNQSALEIAGIPSLDNCIGVNLFNNPHVASRKEELLNKKLIRFQAPLDFDNIKRNGFYTPTKGGTAFIDWIVSVIDSGFLVQIQDITKIKSNEKRLSDVIHGSPVLTFVIDRDHKVLNWNKAIEEYSGFSGEEIIGTQDHWKAFYKEKRPLLADLVVEEKFKEIYSWYPYCTKSKIVKGAYEVEMFFPTMGIIPAVGKKGRWLRATASTINDSLGKIIGAVEVLEDITERKKAEEELQKAHEILEEKVKKRTSELQIERDNLNTILNTTKSGIYIVNSNYELEYINSVIEKDFGLIKGQKCHEYFYDEDDICFECKIQEAFEGNIVEWEQHSYRTGKVFDALATPIIKLDGSMSVVVFLYDVTQRDKAKKALKESEEKFRELFNNAEDMITLGETLEDGTPGKFIEVNEAATRRLGYSREELLNMTPLDILQKDIEEAPKEAFKIAETGSATFETVHVAKNGSKIPVEVKIVILNLDGKDVLLGISRDVTERKNTEKALRESEEKFREIFNNANDMISLNEMIEGFPGKFIEINEVGIKRLGYSREELLNMGPADIVAPDKRPEMSANAAKLLKNSCNTFEITHITKNGDKIPVEVNNHLINYKGRKVCLAISRDITERK